jgi:radical SAM protein with 4Fe4S-binding SPASM domain
MKAKLDREGLKLDPRLAVRYVRAAQKKARQMGIILQLEEHIVRIIKNDWGNAACLWPWWSCFITVDGYLTPCCSRPDPSIFNFGNLIERSFETIWNSSQYVQFRAMLKSGKPPAVCKDCWLANVYSTTHPAIKHN